MKNLTTIVAVLVVSLYCSTAEADLRLPSIFSDGMVIQRDQPVEVWGWSNPGSQIHVLLSTTGSDPARSYVGTCQANAAGQWSTQLIEGDGNPNRTDANWKLVVTEHSGTRPKPDLSIRLREQGFSVEEPGNATTHLAQRIIDDVLVGEVWLCGGQSNMEWSVDQSDGDGRGRKQMANPNIRLINAPRVASAKPQEDIDARWESCTPMTLGAWTAVGYFFADRLNHDLNVPIGLISSNWGGTRIEPWIDRADLREHPIFRDRTNALIDQIQYWEGMDEERVHRLQTDARKRLENDHANYWRQINAEDSGYQKGWMSVDLDDRDWSEMELPGEWEHGSEELSDFDGTVWFRRKVEIPEEWQGRDDVVLNLGGVDDSDQTYFNGTLIGTSTDWVSRNRRYAVPARLLTQGTATLTVCALDPHGAGGLTGPRITLDTRDGAESIDLSGLWKWRAGLATTRTVQSSVVLPANPGDTESAYGSLNNGMINPLVPYSLRGAIWYQGEANEHQADEYRSLLPLLIESWRSDFGDQMAFGIVQLAAFRAPSDDPDQGGWAHLRDAQRHAFETVPNTGLVVTTDVGDADDIHPRNKKAVGDRLAEWALHDVYGVDEAVPSGPIAAGAQRSGAGIIVKFEHCADQLAVAGGGRTPGGFALAGPDGRFFWATATLEGKNEVLVQSNQVRDPRIVSYGWQDNPVQANLVNTKMLPACPFKMDVTAPGAN